MKPLFKYTLVFVWMLLHTTGLQAISFSAEKLSCEYLTNPLGIGISHPRLSWMTHCGQNDFRQTAYEILVSDNESLLNQHKGNQWESGKVQSDSSLHIPYNGFALKPFTRYYWKVRIYDTNHQVGEWSKSAWFETAMLTSGDWTARWIGDGQKQFERDEDFYQNDRMPLFRKAFQLKKKLSAARLYICGLGYYEAYINGKRVGDHVLDPGWTAHQKQALYVIYDVTDLFRNGENIAGIALGNGWYNPLPLRLFGRFNIRDHQQTGRPVVKAQIRLTYNDGTTETIHTDESWQTTKGPIIRNNVYLGEKLDARLEVKHWNTPDADLSGWKQAVIEQGPSGKLSPQMQPAVKMKEVLKPIHLWKTRSNTWIFDLGVNFAGTARLRVKGAKGTTVTLRYGENIHADSTLNWWTTTPGHIKSMWNLSGGSGAPADAIQEDCYVLKGGGEEEYMPRFTFHGFRYVEVFNYPGTPSLSDLDGIRLSADLPVNGSFCCSNEMFNKLHEVTKRTFESNVFSVQSDCPGREKMGYGGDMVATAESFIYNYDMSNFYRKTVHDFVNDQTPEGGMTEIAPYTGIADRGIGGESGPLGWQLAFPYLQKQLYDFYGDKEIIEACYPAFVRQMEFIQSKAINGLFHWDIGDHIALDPRAEAFSACAFYYAHAKLLAEFAGITGREADAEKYNKLVNTIRTSIIKKYYIPHTGRIDNATQAAQAMALYYDLTPDRDQSFDQLLSEYARHNGHISTGIFTCKMAFDVLREANRNDIAYQLVNQREYPGWGYMLSKGATTLWESWDYPENGYSQNHPMFGSTEEWFYRSLLGINPGKPGFKEIIIKPQPAGDLTWAKGGYTSVYGQIVSDWKIDGHHYLLYVEIPANTTATIYVKTTDPTVVKTSAVVKPEKYEDGYAVYRIPSGKYTFESVL